MAKTRRTKRTSGDEIRISLDEDEARALRHRKPSVWARFRKRGQGLARASGKVVIFTDPRGRPIARAMP